MRKGNELRMGYVSDVAPNVSRPSMSTRKEAGGLLGLPAAVVNSGQTAAKGLPISFSEDQTVVAGTVVV